HTRSKRDWSSDVCSSDLFLVTFSHPYRKKVRAAVESTGRKYKTSVAQIMPLFPLWLALMILPAFQIHSWVATLIVLALAGAYARSEERRVGKGGRAQRAQ